MNQESGIDVFLLTKPPKIELAGLCRKLLAQSENAVLYLAGDGVYNLIGESTEAYDTSSLHKLRIIACKEDMQARGVPPREDITAPTDFYDQFVEDIMEKKNRIRII